MRNQGVAVADNDNAVGLPLHFDMVLMFTQYLINTQLKIASVDKYQRDLNIAAQMEGYTDALFLNNDTGSTTRTPMGARLRRHLKGAAKFDGRPSSHVLALQMRLIQRVHVNLGRRATPTDSMFRAWSILSHHLMARAIETTNGTMQWGDIKWASDLNSATIYIARAKQGHFLKKFFKRPKTVRRNTNKSICIIRALLRWRECCIKAGLPTTGTAPLWVAHDGAFGALSRAALTYRQALVMLRHYLEKGGIGRADLFGTHSFRAGGLVDLIRLGVPREDRKNMGDWLSNEGMRPYERTDQHTMAHAFDHLGTLLQPHDTDDTLFADASDTVDDAIFEHDDIASLRHIRPPPARQTAVDADDSDHGNKGTYHEHCDN